MSSPYFGKENRIPSPADAAALSRVRVRSGRANPAAFIAMNYLAHGRCHVDDPYFLAGTAIPDWLNVVDRRVRVRSKHARPLADHHDPNVAALARGVLQHHHDDAWFHQTRAFAELSMQFTVGVRDALPPDHGMRAFFLGHILVEILLDAQLAADQPQVLHEYYAAVAEVDPAVVAGVVGRMSGRGADGLVEWIPRFVAERFLWDYADDEKLLTRLNQVMARVKLPKLPPELIRFFPSARQSVAQRASELLGRQEFNGGDSP